IKLLKRVVPQYTQIKYHLIKAKKYAEVKNNLKAKEELKKVEEMIYIPLVDKPLSEAKYLIMVAKDHFNGGNYQKSRQALRLALHPINRVIYKENLYILYGIYLIENAYTTYKDDPYISKLFMKEAVNNLEQAVKVASVRKREKLQTIKETILNKLQKYNSFSITEEDFEEIFTLFKKLEK
ncbi:MAG: hypothetical protein GXO45_01505, partial [Aquificae bacterium]|nr:hypothetical protein [Aquificota bacterium]